VKAPVSLAYNRNISIQTVKWAIVDWLQDKHHHGIWSVHPFPSFLSIYLTISRTSSNLTFLYSRTKFADSKLSSSPSVLECRSPPFRIVEWSATEPGIRSYSTSAQCNPYIYPHNAAPHPQNGSKGADLMEEFDKGIRIIESWEIGNDGA